jgi:hypothetical protein
MVENEKLINEENKLPKDILSDTVDIEENNQDTAKADEIKDVSIFGTTFDVNTAKPIEEKSEVKIEEPKPEKVSDVTSSYSEEQKKDFNRLLELNVEPEKAKKIIAGESVEIKKLDTDGKSEYEVEKEILANKGIDLDLIKKAKPEAVKISEEIYVDSAGIETKGGYVPAKTLYELNGYNADKENEITGDIRFNLGFGLDGDQFKENNIKNMLIKRITNSGKYDKEVLANYLDKIEVKAVNLKYEGTSKKGLVYRIPKELGGTNMFSAVDSPKISSSDLSDAVADSGPIVASIVGGTLGSSLGPLGTIGGSAVSAGFAEYARLMYGYHSLGLQNDIYPDPEEFNKIALNMSIKYAAIDAVATGVFLAGAKLILPTILNKNQLSTSTIKEFVESEGKTNTGIFKEVNKVKEQMKKDFNFTQAEVDNYFAVSVGKAILNSDQLIKKGSAAQRALLSDEVTKLETRAEFKAIEDKIIKQTTNVSEIGNKQADKVIENIQKQIVGQAEVGIKEAELALIKNSKGLITLEKSFVDDAAGRYLDEFGVTLDDTYKILEARISTLNKNIETGILKNKTPIKFNVSNAIKILENDLKRFTFKRGLLPKKLKTIGKRTSPENAAKIKDSNTLFKLSQLFNEAGFQKTGNLLKDVKEGFKVLQRKQNITLKDVVTLKNAVNLLIETTDNATASGALKQLSKNINANISEAITKSKDEVLSKQFGEQLELLNLKRSTFFKNFADDFGSSTTKEGMENLKYSSENLFNRIVNDSTVAREEAMAFGDLIKKNLVPAATVEKINQALYRNYFNKVIPSADNVAEMTHKQFFKKFGKNYESLLGKKLYSKLAKDSDGVFKAVDESLKGVNEINATVAKFLPGIENFSILRNSGPGEIVEHILSPAFTKTANLTKLLNALPVQTVKEIRELFLTRMMKDVTGESFVPNKMAQVIGGTPLRTGTINGTKMNSYLNANRSALLQLYSPEFFRTMRSMADVLEMLQPRVGVGKAADASARQATENAALFIDMIYGPLNHKRLILNRASRLFDKMGLSSDNLMLFSDYGLFVEAAQKNFLAGNYPRWMTKLPQKERGVFIDKAMRLINKTIDFANLGLNRGAGLRKMFTANPLKNPMLAKEYLEDKVEGDDDRMEDNADMFFPVDVAGKYAIKSLMAVFGKAKELTVDKVTGAFKESEKVKERDLKQEEFNKKLEN